MPSLLVVDDDLLIRECFRSIFPTYQVWTAGSARDGLSLFAEKKPDVVLLDIRLPDLSGLEAFRQFHQSDSRVPIILMTGFGRAGTAIDAMRLGAYEYVVKPLDPTPLRGLVQRACEVSRLMRVPARMADTEPGDDAADVLVGHCPSMREVYKGIGRVASQDVTVLILGESGTGKELVARAIYHYSKRASGPFLAINCAAIPETLLESELFGHEKGAFTGADRKRIGKFEQCNGGTLFLDEIGDMTPLTQTKILRVLQEKEFERVGGNESIRTDVRVIAATNRNVEAMIASGQFRADLFFRLNVYTLRLPPLRERGDDLNLLAEHFVGRFSRELNKDIRAIAPDTLALLGHYSWPGNVRELQSVLQQAILQATGPILLPEYLPASVRGDDATPAPASRGEFRDLERFIDSRLAAGTTDLYSEAQAATDLVLLRKVLEHVHNNQTQAARILGISRVTMRSKLHALGISVDRTMHIDEAAS